MSSSALCDICAWETGGYFWNIILKSREGYQVSFHLLVLICGANHTTILNDKMKSYVVRREKKKKKRECSSQLGFTCGDPCFHH